MLSGWFGAIVLRHTRTDSFSSCGTRRVVDAASCCIDPARPRASAQAHAVDGIDMGPPPGRRRGFYSATPGSVIASATMTTPVAGLLLALAAAQPAPPYKLGTFQAEGRTFVGLVRTDQSVVEISGVADMRDLIGRYEELKARLRELSAQPAPQGAKLHSLAKLKLRPPVPNPETMLNAAVNYTEHDAEM